VAEVPIGVRVVASGSTTIPSGDGHGNAAVGLSVNGSEVVHIEGKLTGGGISLSTPVYLLFNTLLPSAFYFGIAAEGETPDVIGLSLKFVAGGICVLRWERIGSNAGSVGVDWKVIGTV